MCECRSRGRQPRCSTRHSKSASQTQTWHPSCACWITRPRRRLKRRSSRPEGGVMKGLHHVGITVKNLDASIRFYHDVLGLGFVNEPSPWFEGDKLGRGVGVPGAALRQVSLLVGDTTIELLEYKAPPSDTLRPLASNSLG